MVLPLPFSRMNSPVLARPVVLADLTPGLGNRTILRNAVLVTGFALLTAVAAQVSIPLGFTPVPLTGQTLAVLLAGASLGRARGAASQALYWVMGLVGLPFYSGGAGGWDAGTGSTLGYLVGFVAAAAVVGHLAEQRHDRRVVTSLSAMALGTAVIYACGAAWLSFDLGIPLATGEKNAVSLGITPFIVGDAIKMILAGLLTPAVWAVVSGTNDRD